MPVTPLPPGALGPNGLQYSTIEASTVQPPTRTGGDDRQDELTSLVLSVRQAAMNPTALEQLAMLLLEQEPVRASPYLGPLLRPAPGAAASIPGSGQPRQPRAADTAPVEPPRNIGACSAEDLQYMRERWREHVLWHSDSADVVMMKITGQLTPPSPTGLLEFGATYVREHPAERPRKFFRPFYELAQRDIDIPSNIAMAFERGVLPYKTFRKLVAVYVTELPLSSPMHLANTSDLSARSMPGTYWHHTLAALCSPLAMTLLDSGAITPDILLRWTGLAPLIERTVCAAASGTRAVSPQHATPIASLLASLGKSDGDATFVKNAAQLKEPEKLRALADNLVPYKHLEYLVSLAGSVDWPVLAEEMDRVIAQNQTSTPVNPRNANIYTSDHRRSADYKMNEAQIGRLEQSRRKMAPYELLGRMRIRGRLDNWSVAGISGTAQASLQFQPRSTAALFDHWAARAVPIEQQAWMARFMAQGFSESRAWALSTPYAQDPTRLQAWFAHGHDADLGPRLDQAMKDGVARWLADTTLPPDTLALLPAMIQSDLSVDCINNIVRMGHVPHHVKAMFGPHSNATAKVWYGVVTPDQVYRHAMALDDAIDDAAEIEALEAYERSQELSQLRRNAAETRDRLRRMRHAMETLRTAISADTPQARLCARYADAWRNAIIVLDDLLQPALETRQRQHPDEIAKKLATLNADLSFQISSLEEARDPPGLQTLA